MSERIIYVNGEFVPESEARISVLDHAVLYGDGVFETAVAWNGRVFKLERISSAFTGRWRRSPWKRRSAREDSRRRSWNHPAQRLPEAYVKWIATRGSNGTPLMDPDRAASPNLIILMQPYIDRGGADGLRVKTTAIRRPPGHVLDAHIKSLNYLNLVLAKIEAKSAGADQALMLDVHGHSANCRDSTCSWSRARRCRRRQTTSWSGMTRETVIEIAPDARLRGRGVVLRALSTPIRRTKFSCPARRAACCRWSSWTAAASAAEAGPCLPGAAGGLPRRARVRALGHPGSRAQPVCIPAE